MVRSGRALHRREEGHRAGLKQNHGQSRCDCSIVSLWGTLKGQSEAMGYLEAGDRFRSRTAAFISARRGSIVVTEPVADVEEESQ